MHKNRLEAFSDGVLAIVITIMVLEMKVPQNHFATLPVAAYGFVLLMAAIAYWILQQRIIASQGEVSILKKAVRHDWKGRVSPLLYSSAIVLAFVSAGQPSPSMPWWH